MTKTIATCAIILIVLFAIVPLFCAFVESTNFVDSEVTLPQTTQEITPVETQPETVPDCTMPEPIPEPTPEEILWEQHLARYPVATRMWAYIKEQFGWSDEVCAGIIGNVMAETGARTLDIPFKEYRGGPFGLFQWIKTRRETIAEIYGYDATIEEQLEFVYDELYGTDGIEQQVEDYQRELILNAKTASKAAERFCDWFERPKGKGTIQQKYAKIAYEYFTSEGA